MVFGCFLEALKRQMDARQPVEEESSSSESEDEDWDDGFDIEKYKKYLAPKLDADGNPIPWQC